MIIADSNERDTVKKYLRQLKIAHVIEPLKIDDIGVADYANRPMTFLLERKSAFDYRSSLLSGHLEIQLARMCDLFDGPKYLLFEGSLEALIETEKNPGIKALMKTFPLRVAHVYGTHFIECDTPYDTAVTLKMLDKYTKAIKDPPVKFEPIYMSKEVDEKVRVLLVTPRLGQKNAKVLIDKYKSVASVITRAHLDPKSLSDIPGIGKTSVENMDKLFNGLEPYIKKKNKRKPSKKSFAVQRSNYNKIAGGKNKSS